MVESLSAADLKGTEKLCLQKNTIIGTSNPDKDSSILKSPLFSSA